mgnify:CR=1 FL=1
MRTRTLISWEGLKAAYLLSVVLLLSFPSTAQDATTELHVTASANLFVPLGSSGKYMYPVLWYNSDTDPKFQVGGWGIGVTATKPFTEKWLLKSQFNISRHAYWDESYFFTEDGTVGAYYTYRTVEYTVGIQATANYALSEKLLVGSGVVFRALVSSKTNITELDKRIANKMYKPVVPLLPVELTYKSNKMMYSMRYEYGLGNRYKGDLAKVQKDRYSLLVFEVSLLIK